MNAGEQNRYEHWMKKIDTLASKHNLTITQTVCILDNINEFKNVFNWVETSKFIAIYKKEITK